MNVKSLNWTILENVEKKLKLLHKIMFLLSIVSNNSMRHAPHVNMFYGVLEKLIHFLTNLSLAAFLKPKTLTSVGRHFEAKLLHKVWWLLKSGFCSYTNCYLHFGNVDQIIPNMCMEIKFWANAANFTFWTHLNNCYSRQMMFWNGFNKTSSNLMMVGVVATHSLPQVPTAERL